MSTSESSSTPPILRGIHAALPAPLLSQILSSRILLVGSGGIGCELLKNLALSGFRHVQVIDLDTIDVSNLNRQFLFRSRHVGMAKCKVASEAAMQMIPPLHNADNDDDDTPPAYVPHHGNILDNNQFHVPYIQTFSLVLNALDNITARRRVNRLCLASGIPLIEAGTAGYLGQVTVIDKNAGVECYECQAKSTQKVYPICTIRSTPSMPVHCVVWAKELYKLCFGGKVEESMLFEDEESLRAEKDGAADENDLAEKSSADTTDGAGKTDTEKSTDASNKSVDSTTNNNEPPGEKSTHQSKDDNFESTLRLAAQQALTALFVTEINKQIGMNRYKNAEKVPLPLSLEDLEKCTATEVIPPTQRKDYQPTQIWSPAECLVEMVSCFLQVSNSSTPPLPEFDKDDEMAMRFVTAASNLRSYVFHIEPIQSLYSAKGIAGNIIPAIATTNAIVAGLQVLQAFHILKCQWMYKNGEIEDVGGGIKKLCRYTYCLREKTRRGYILQPTTLPLPNPNCFVCRNAVISLSLNTKEWTLQMLLTRVIKKELGFSQPTILVGGDIVYEEGDDIDPSEYASNLSKKLIGLPSGGVGHGTVIGVEDFTQDLEVEICVSHKDEWFIAVEDEVAGGKKDIKLDDREESEKFEIGGKKPSVPPSAATTDEAQTTKDSTADDDDSSVEVMGMESTANNAQKPSAENNGSSKEAEAGNVEDDDDDSDIEIIEGGTTDAVAATSNENTSESRMPLKKRRLDWDRENQNGDDAKKAKIAEDTPAANSAEIEIIEIDSD
ncbi:hypothetical protein HJC23_003088 [Cyclotella cryptica]|uniref:SUMO-activating enzyme subunit n=1 Tax=Cyclotella cryptica TaxID=29204 RepID=A0ABD3P4S3_9STRA|eukprot:CCRYP_017669-RA/>CCRYP_017669-RA protein AED:0.06 eAED:0.06 QI:184/0.5/0.33/1/1/1/3/0/779